MTPPAVNGSCGPLILRSPDSDCLSKIEIKSCSMETALCSAIFSPSYS